MFMLFEDMVHIMYCSEADIDAGWHGYNPNRHVSMYSSSDEDSDGKPKKYFAGEVEARDSARKRLRGTVDTTIPVVKTSILQYYMYVVVQCTLTAVTIMML